MIAAPTRIVPPSRGPAAARPTGSNGGDADLRTAFAAIDSRLASLVTRTPTPDDEALEQQREAFDAVARERAELARETNVLRDLAMEQVKNDDELLKKWIALI